MTEFDENSKLSKQWIEFIPHLGLVQYSMLNTLWSICLICNVCTQAIVKPFEIRSESTQNINISSILHGPDYIGKYKSNEIYYYVSFGVLCSGERENGCVLWNSQRLVREHVNVIAEMKIFKQFILFEHFIIPPHKYNGQTDKHGNRHGKRYESNLNGCERLWVYYIQKQIASRKSLLLGTAGTNVVKSMASNIRFVLGLVSSWHYVCILYMAAFIWL